MDAYPDIYFLPEWGQAYQSKEKGGELRTFEIRNEIGHVYYQFIIREIPLQKEGLKYYDIITPFGFSGPVILECAPKREQEMIRTFNDAFQEYCVQHRIVTEYVRFNGWINNMKDFEGIYEKRHHGTTVFIDLTVPNFFTDEFSSNARRLVKRSRENNVEIEFDFSGASSHEFARLYGLMVEKNAVTNEYYQFTEEFIRTSFNYLSGKQFIVNAKHEGKYIASALFLHHGDYLHSHLAANDPAYFRLAASSLITYEACRWGVDNGKKVFHLGGASNDRNLHRFKMGFTRTEPLDLLIGMKIRDHEVYNQLASIKEKMAGSLDEDYFPLYRG